MVLDEVIEAWRELALEKTKYFHKEFLAAEHARLRRIEDEWRRRAEGEENGYGSDRAVG